MTFEKGKSGNPAGRRKGVPNKRTMAAGAIERHWGSCEAFWDKIAKQAAEGCMESVKILVSRTEPAFKPVAVPVSINLPDGATTADAVPVVVQAIACGDIPPDEGSNLLNALLAGTKLEKLDELEKRINELLESHGKR